MFLNGIIKRSPSYLPHLSRVASPSPVFALLQKAKFDANACIFMLCWLGFDEDTIWLSIHYATDNCRDVMLLLFDGTRNSRHETRPDRAQKRSSNRNISCSRGNYVGKPWITNDRLKWRELMERTRHLRTPAAWLWFNELHCKFVRWCSEQGALVWLSLNASCKSRCRCIDPNFAKCKLSKWILCLKNC